MRKALNGKTSKDAKFVAENTKRHVKFTFYYKGKATGLHTEVSHGPGKNTIPEWLLSKMKKQLHLSKEDFYDYVDCNKKCDDLAKIYIKQGEFNASGK